MKHKSRNILIASMIMLGGLINTPTQADPPGMPGDHGSSGNQPPGGGAPLGGGLIILITAAGAYAYIKHKNQTPEYQIEE